MKYRVTIEEFKEEDDRGYDRWHEVYQQELEYLDVHSVVASLNTTEIMYPVVAKERQES